MVKIIVGVLGIRKADQATGFCSLLGGIAAPILFIVGGGQNKKAAAK